MVWPPPSIPSLSRAGPVLFKLILLVLVTESDQDERQSVSIYLRKISWRPKSPVVRLRLGVSAFIQNLGYHSPLFHSLPLPIDDPEMSLEEI